MKKIRVIVQTDMDGQSYPVRAYAIDGTRAEEDLELLNSCSVSDCPEFVIKEIDLVE